MDEAFLAEFSALGDEEKRFIMSGDTNSDPAASERKRAFWIRMIKTFCKEEKTSCFEAEGFAEYVFSKTGMVPSDLTANILSEPSVHVVDLEDMLKFLQPSVKESKWNVFANVYEFWKTFARKFSFSGNSNDSTYSDIKRALSQPKFVSIDMIKENSKHIVDLIEEKNVATIPLSQLYKDTQDFFDKTTLKMVIMYLQKTSQCVVQKSPTGIKFMTIIKNVDEFEPLSEVDLQLLELRERALEIDEDMSRLFERIKLCMQQAIKFKREGCELQALHAMKVKKYYEFDQERLNIELEQNLKMRNSLKQAEASIKMRKMSASFNKTCRDIQTKSGTTADEMGEIIADTSEIFDESSDSIFAIKHTMEQTRENIDEDELKKELDDLMALNVMQEFNENEMKEQEEDKTNKEEGKIQPPKEVKRKPGDDGDDAEVPPKRVLRGKK